MSPLIAFLAIALAGILVVGLGRLIAIALERSANNRGKKRRQEYEESRARREEHALESEDHYPKELRKAEVEPLRRRRHAVNEGLREEAPRVIPREKFDLRLMSVADGESRIPTEGKNLVVVAAIDQVLHFRVFDSDGNRVVDTDERRLTEQVRLIEDLREQLESLWPPHELTGSEKRRVITAVGTIVGHPPPEQGGLPPGSPGDWRIPGVGPNSMQQDAVGLALSGGGIRSATFALGVIQSFAHTELLRYVDCLSTVSGGGYVGAFLGRLFTRNDQELAEGLRLSSPMWLKRPRLVQEILKSTFSEPMVWLRENGRYLAPTGSGDLFLGSAILLRNWVAVQVVLVVYLLVSFLFLNLLRFALVAAAPELFAFLDPGWLWGSPYFLVPAILLILFAIPFGLAYWLIPIPSLFAAPVPIWRTYLLPFIQVVALGLLGLWFAHLCWESEPKRAYAALIVADMAFLALAYAAVALLVIAYYLEKSGSEMNPWLRDDLSVSLRSSLTWTLATLMFAILDSCGQSLYAAVRAFPTGGKLPAQAAALLTVLSTLAVWAQRIAVQFGGASDGRRAGLPLSVLAGLAAFLCTSLLLVTISAVAHGLSYGGEVPEGYKARSNPGARILAGLGLRDTVEAGASKVTSATEYLSNQDPNRQITITERKVESVAAEPPPPGKPVRWSWLITAFALATGFALAAGQVWQFLNRSSQQALYGGRLTRAYLGASNPLRWTGKGVPVVNVVEGDGIPLEDYAPHEAGGPLHFLNVTINETLDGKSQLEQHDRKGVGMAIGAVSLSAGARQHALWDLPAMAAPHPPRQGVRGLKPQTTQFRVFDLEAALAPGGTGTKTIAVEPLRLDDWMGISGAAFSTGLGARTSLGLSLLCGLFNVRLGYWWDSGMIPERRPGRPASSLWKWFGSWSTWLFPVQMYLLDEFTARYHGTARRHWYLTDGGHFENMGAYELIRRRVPRIIVCDGEQDDDYTFEGLANLVRKARIDFGAEIRFLTGSELDHYLDPALRPFFGTLEELRRGKWADEPVNERQEALGVYRVSTKRRTLDPLADRFSLAHAALARIAYPGDPEVPWRYLLYIKASLTGDEPADVLQYHKAHPSFPQEPTVNQFFDEQQWESYRRLGEHIGMALLGTEPSQGGWSPREWIVNGRPLP
jgi:hypothetical protein